MTDRDLPPEQASPPSSSERESRDRDHPGAAPPPTPLTPLPGHLPSAPLAASAEPGARPPRTVAPPPVRPGRSPFTGQRQPSPGPDNRAAADVASGGPAHTDPDLEQTTNYHGNDPTEIYDRANFPAPPLRESPTAPGHSADPGAAGQHRPIAEPPRHQAPPFGQPPARQRPPAPQESWADQSAPPQGDARPWGEQPAPGSANWSYVDSIRPSELVPTRKLPSRKGWRKALYKGSFGLINVGQSPDERRLAELEAKIRSLLRGRYKIGVLGKGGVGKTTVAAGVGSIFAELRQDDRVVAIDADTAFGKLGLRIDPNAKGSYWELAADEYLRTFADVRSRVGNNAAGLFVLAGESSTARRRVLDPSIYREATARLDNHFTLSIIDCGSTMDSAVTREVLRDLDALIVVSSMWVDGASAAAQTMELLANTGHTGLLHRTVVVLNDSDGHADKRTREVLHEQFGQRGQIVVEVPFDRHLRPGGVIDIQGQVDKTTRRRFIEIAAAIAEHFPATSDNPRGRR
ncbi:MinD/ParA family ATP-binding protein [Mycobacterium lehmannii]|uniref:MinD/ParA family ATP-binding protein n=1 Tax=Mycobacterium lehmannii TaxID=2048550 RepID=UPI000B94149C|nr:MinD/ParA family protein [Mycobacterium lehmannii]